MPKVTLSELGETLASSANSGDWLSRVNETITNLKDLVTSAREAGVNVPNLPALEGDAVVTNAKRQTSKPVGIAPPKASKTPDNTNIDIISVKKFWALFCLSGYGDKTVEQLLKEISPHTPRQLAKQFGGLLNVKSS